MAQNKELNKLRLAFEQTPGAIFILDKNFRFEYVNPGFEKLSGYIKEELINKTVAELFYDEEVHKSREKLVECMLKGEKWDGELLTHNKNGNHYWANTVASPYKDENNNIKGYIIVQHDITDRKKMETALRESEQKYRELAEMLPQTVYEMDLEGYQTYLNRAGIEAFRYNSSPIGRYAFDFIAPEDHARMRENMLRSIKDQDFTAGNEYTGVRDDGSRFPIIIYGSPISEKGEIVGTRGIIIDISERKAMENAILESEKKYRTVIDNASDGIVITQEGKLMFLNKSMYEMMQYEESEILGTSYYDMVVPEDHQIMVEFHKRRMAGENFTSLYRSRFIRKDGKIINVELNARTSDYNGSPAAFIIIRDISDRVKIENELQIAKTKLEKLNNQLEKRVKESSESLTEARTQLINLQKENLQSQFDVLKQQVNPHFLFNSLNVLTSLIKLEPDLAEKFSEQLSKVYRYVLENKDNELVDLQTELNFLDAYIFLLNIRFVNKLKVNINIPEARRNDQIIPLAMQLLIENAIKHNTMSKSEPLHINIFIDENNMLNIVNNLQERPSQLASTGVGLKNILNRYQLLGITEPVFRKTTSEFIAQVPLVITDSNVLNS
ncbi:MAG: PAS domain S-box protein [Paludibacter sp.]|nr:PAS domain S-box protein [Paludibacter sp.]